MKRYFLELSYDGTAYCGWQVQPGIATVQLVLSEALSRLLRQPIAVHGQGRTDTGVHARKCFAHFEFEPPFPPNFLFRINKVLPSDIAIIDVFEVPEKAHARFSAMRRTYHYIIHTHKDPFWFNRAAHVPYALDYKAMDEACDILTQYIDFSCFSRSNTQVKTNDCTLYEAHWTVLEQHSIFTITANRFLRNMVRAIVGTMLDIGKGKLQAQDLHTIIQGKQRSDAGQSAHACGLYLMDVMYPDWVFEHRNKPLEMVQES